MGQPKRDSGEDGTRGGRPGKGKTQHGKDCKRSTFDDFLWAGGSDDGKGEGVAKDIPRLRGRREGGASL